MTTKAAALKQRREANLERLRNLPPPPAPSIVPIDDTASPTNVQEKIASTPTVPKKKLTILVPQDESKDDPKKIGRPTNKTGDLESDYVKISPKISRSLKDQMDRAVLDLRKDPRLGILTLEDLVSNAVHEYLKKHQVARP